MAVNFAEKQADKGFAANGDNWKFTPLDQGVILRGGGQMDEGICAEICRRWVRRRNNLDGGWSEATLDQIVGIEGGALALLPKINEQVLAGLVDVSRRNERVAPGNLRVQGMDAIAHSQRSYVLGCCGRQGFAWDLSSRSSILNAVLSAGLYILTASNGGVGHAVAFDTRNGGIHFMDPNTGEFWIDPSAGAVPMFREWFTSYWGAIYKGLYNKGRRNLYQYA